MDLPIVHRLPTTIALMLPQNYLALDLGSGYGKDSKKIEDECTIMGKEGKFINVDPFINQEGIFKESMEDFVANY